MLAEDRVRKVDNVSRMVAGDIWYTIFPLRAWFGKNKSKVGIVLCVKRHYSGPENMIKD